MNYGFVKVAAAIPELKVGDCDYNASRLIEMTKEAHRKNVGIVVFPELSFTGYTCADLFFQQKLLLNAQNALTHFLDQTKGLNVVTITGMPFFAENKLFNVAIVAYKGEIKGIVPKTNLPNNNEFYEKRWFAPASNAKGTSVIVNNKEIPFGTDLLFKCPDFTFGVEICEDVWVPIPPSSQLAIQGAELIFNLSATNELIGKHTYLRQLIEQQSARCNAGYVYASAGFGESTTDVVYAGNGLVAENGQLIATSERFLLQEQLVVSEIDVEKLRAERMKNTNFCNETGSQIYRKIEFNSEPVQVSKLERTFAKLPFVPAMDNRDTSCNEIFNIQVGGLAQRWKHTNAKTVVLGISGGLDSTLALLVCVKTADKLGFDRKRITAITMPGFGTTGRTYNNAIHLMESLGVNASEISIKDACLQHFKDIGHDGKTHDVTYENTQARERTQILMDIANKQNGMVIGTGDLSELALGWATYNGDHMSMYAVNSGVPKTLVRYLVDWAAQQLDRKSQQILKDVLNTPVSPELLPADENGAISQKTEDLVGPYELHDFFLYYFVRFGFSPEKIRFIAKETFVDEYDELVIEKWLHVFIKRFFAQQFKRSCMPDGPKVGSINLSPRGDWRMPSDAIAFNF